MTNTNKRADDEPITEKEPNSVLTQRDIEAIARDEDHVWQSNRPETSSGNKSSAAKPARSKPFAPSGLPGKKEALPAFIPPQLASEAPEPPVGEHWVHELKLDGYRIQAHIDKAGKVRLYTRSGLDWTHRMAAGGAGTRAAFGRERHPGWRSGGARSQRTEQLCRSAGSL